MSEGIRSKFIYKACQNGNLFALKALLVFNKRYINASVIDRSYTNQRATPLELACEHGHDHMVKYLMNNEVDPNKTGRSDANKPLYIICNKQLETDRSMELIRNLVEHGANINARNFNNESALHSACKNNNMAAIIYLVNNGADINAKDNGNKTPLHIACEKNNYTLVEYLVAKEADMTAQANNTEYFYYSHIDTLWCTHGKPIKTYFTPLQIALKHNNKRIIGLLLDNLAEQGPKKAMQFCETMKQTCFEETIVDRNFFREKGCFKEIYRKRRIKRNKKWQAILETEKQIKKRLDDL